MARKMQQLHSTQGGDGVLLTIEETVHVNLTPIARQRAHEQYLLHVAQLAVFIMFDKGVYR